MTISNRDIEKLYDKYNPRKVQTGDRVLVKLHEQQFFARIVGLELDIKNRKVFANLKLLEKTSKNRPIRVDVTDCHHAPLSKNLYPGHHHN